MGFADTAEPFLRIASILGRAHFHCVMSGLRLGYETTGKVLRGQLRLLTYLTDPDSQEGLQEHALRVIVDETRGCLREIADISAEEFRRLQFELGNLQLAARAVVPQPDNHARTTPTRRNKAKS